MNFGLGFCRRLDPCLTATSRRCRDLTDFLRPDLGLDRTEDLFLVNIRLGFTEDCLGLACTGDPLPLNLCVVCAVDRAEDRRRCLDLGLDCAEERRCLALFGLKIGDNGTSITCGIG